MVTGTTDFWMDIATKQACAENRATNNGLLATVVTAVGWQNLTHCSWLLLFLHRRPFPFSLSFPSFFEPQVDRLQQPVCIPLFYF